MNWDGSRVAAAIPSGVGFLGAGIIWKQENKDGDGHTVSGLTTAASIWLSAAVGIACSGELYFAATFSVAVMLLLLRFGPRTPSDEESASYAGSTSALENIMRGYKHDDVEASMSTRVSIAKYMNEYGATVENEDHMMPEELQSLKPRNGTLSTSSSMIDITQNGQDTSYRKRSNSFKKKKKPSLME